MCCCVTEHNWNSLYIVAWWRRGKKVFIWPMSEASLRSPSIRGVVRRRELKNVKNITHKDLTHNVTLYIMYSQHKISSSCPVQCKIHRKLLAINSHNIHFSFSTSRRCLGSPAANKKKINLIQKKIVHIHTKHKSVHSRRGKFSMRCRYMFT